MTTTMGGRSRVIFSCGILMSKTRENKATASIASLLPHRQKMCLNNEHMEEKRVDRTETTEELLRKNLETNQEMLRLMRREVAWRRFASVVKFLLLAGTLG